MIVESMCNFCSPQPLVDCYKTLRQREDVVFDVQISDTWTRHYQVALDNTHS